MGCHARRNRVRRRLLEASRTLAWPEAFDLILTAGPGAVNATYPEIVQELEVLARRCWEIGANDSESR